MSTEEQNLITMDSVTLTNAIEKDFRLLLENIERVTSGWSSQVFKGTHVGDIVYIRINKNPRIFSAEVIGYKLFLGQGIPVPVVIAYEENPPHIGFPTMLLTAAEGENLHDAVLLPEEKDSLYEEAGMLMQKLHNIKLEGYGPAEAHNNTLRGMYNTWKENWQSAESHFIEEISYAAEKGLFIKEEIEKIMALQAKISSLEFGVGSLLHRDIHSAHIFIQNKKISGIIDLGRLLVGDPRYDIAMSLVFQNERHQEHFKKGYGELADDPIVLQYLAIIAATKTAYRSKRGQSEMALKAQKTFRQVLAQIPL
jgi:aminoglycoside phosphotransferase (APT) family kinase protein